MGRLIKNHWARLIVLTAAVYQVGASIEGFIWPKVLWDFASKGLDVIVTPAPILQVFNLVFGLLMFAMEWPLPLFAGSAIHRSMEFRLAFIPLAALAAGLLYQGANSAVYYLIGMMVYFWGYSEGEMISAKPWTLPQRAKPGKV